jgi:DNA repair exonuclease SbcCD ATPase subunit
MINFKSIRWRNFLSYGDHWTQVELNQTKSSLIIGDNGAGKSTILDALSFGLYNKPFRRVTVQQLVNSINSKHMQVEVEFSIGKNVYKVVRGQKPRLFEVWQDGKLLNQEAHAKDYQEVLEKSILKLNHKSFTQVVILGSSSFVPFMQLPTNHRKEVIEDLLDIGIFSVMSTLLKDKVSQNKELVATVKNNLDVLEEKINLQKQYIEKIKVQQDEVVKGKKDKIEQLKNSNQSIEINVTSEEDTRYALEKELKQEEKVRTKLNKLHNLDEKIGDKVKRLKKEIEFFKINDECPTCYRPIDEEFKSDSISNNEGTIKECNDGFDKLEDEILKVKALVDNMLELRNDLNNVTAEINSLKSEMNANVALINSLEEDIQHSSKQNITSEKDKIIDYKKERDDNQSELQVHLDDKEIYGIATKLLKDTGIKSKIIKQYVPIINKLVNKYLAAMDFFVQFELDENFNEVIKSRYRDAFTYASFSEGEKMRIDLALLFTWRAIAKLKNSASTNLLIMDEVFDSSLDAGGTDEFLKIINDLTSDTNIFIISHKTDQLIDKFSHVIRFEKVNNFSRVAPLAA